MEMNCRGDAGGKLRKGSRPSVVTWKLHEGRVVGVQRVWKRGGVTRGLLEYGSWWTRRQCLKDGERGNPVTIKSGQKACCPETVRLLLNHVSDLLLYSQGHIEAQAWPHLKGGEEGRTPPSV